MGRFGTYVVCSPYLTICSSCVDINVYIYIYIHVPRMMMMMIAR